MSDWIESGTKNSAKESLLDSIDLDSLRLADNKTYQSILSELQKLHAELLQLESDGKIDNFRDNPVLVGQYLTKLRLKVNMLFKFINVYLDVLNDLEIELAKKRESLFKEQLGSPGGSVNKAEKYSIELTRLDKARVGVLSNMIKQVENEYERYNGICISLQSRMKEFASERIMG